jgi:hypothetical protein
MAVTGDIFNTGREFAEEYAAPTGLEFYFGNLLSTMMPRLRRWGLIWGWFSTTMSRLRRWGWHRRYNYAAPLRWEWRCVRQHRRCEIFVGPKPKTIRKLRQERHLRRVTKCCDRIIQTDRQSCTEYAAPDGAGILFWNSFTTTMSRLRRWGLIWGSAFYNDVAPLALGVDLGICFLQRCRAYGAVG